MFGEGSYLIPGLQAAIETLEQELWWGRIEQQVIQQGLVDGAARDAGNSPTTALRPGLLLGKVTATGKLKEWDPDASEGDGTEEIYGILIYDQFVQQLGVDKDRWLGWVLVGGNLKPESLVIPGNAARGINGDDYELLAYSQLSSRFRFMEKLTGVSYGWGGFRNVAVIDDDYAITEADNDLLLTTLGAAKAIEFTLPAPRPGFHVGILIGADENVTITPLAAGQLVTDNNAAADTLAYTTSGQQIGVLLELVGLSTSKIAVLVRDPSAVMTGEDWEFTGGTGTNDITVPTNLADALSIHDGVADLMVFTTTTGTPAIAFTPITTFTGLLTANGGITIAGAVDLAFTGTTGQPEIVVPTNLADALSIRDSAADIIVIDTTTGTPAITFTPITTFTGLLTSNGGIVLAGAVDLAFTGTTGQPEIVIPTNLADALSIRDSAADIIVITTTTGTPVVTITPITNVTGRLTGSGNLGNTAGVGITGTATSWLSVVDKFGSLYKTTMIIDLTGLNSGGAADDVIGADGAGVAHLGQITAAVNGTIIVGKLTCLETPAGGDDDIDVHSATESTGVEDTAIADLTETKLCNSGDLVAGTEVSITAPAADQYLYLTGGTGGDATYTAGILMLEFWGK